MKSTSIKTLIFLLCFATATFAQSKLSPAAAQEEAPVLSSGPRSLANQFNELKEKSNTYSDYKVVKVNWLNSFWKNVFDSINISKQKLASAQREITQQKSQLATLKKEIAVRDTNLVKGEYDKAHLTVLGMDMIKENYI